MKLSIYIWLPLYILGVIMGFYLGQSWQKKQFKITPEIIFEKGSAEDLINDFKAQRDGKL